MLVKTLPYFDNIFVCYQHAVLISDSVGSGLIQIHMWKMVVSRCTCMCLLSSCRRWYHEICWVIISACWTRRVHWLSTMKSHGTVPTTCRPSRLLSVVDTGRHWGISTVLLLLTVRCISVVTSL